MKRGWKKNDGKEKEKETWQSALKKTLKNSKQPLTTFNQWLSEQKKTADTAEILFVDSVTEQKWGLESVLTK